MGEINKVVKELWQKTYRNRDIDSIQIKADADGAKSYAYRVVMQAGGAELEMRGRCSAGQKVALIHSNASTVSTALQRENGCWQTSARGYGCSYASVTRTSRRGHQIEIFQARTEQKAWVRLTKVLPGLQMDLEER